ncbi:MAG: carboxypeptidase regulatory-like domain-containing protein, partial [Bryobacteraceae bacterium]|nr:carboxypeptidase regulatory-like domain-containing protein [Bryobacteraceae bacterium]
MHIAAGRVFQLNTVLIFGAALTPIVCQAALPVQLSGTLSGSVRDASGVPQMGATVHLYNRHEKLVEKILTNAGGEFKFASLMPDLYSLKVTVSSFVPAIKRNILVQPGMQSVLAVNLANVLSSVELVYSSKSPGTMMSDDWRWVLRGTMASRPVNRILPGIDMQDPDPVSRTASAMFSDTRGLVKLSSGESISPFSTGNNQPDLGTTFALATSFFGRNQVQFTGNVGYGLGSDVPAAGFRTSFSRGEAGPEFKLTVQQIGIPARGIAVSRSNAPPLRTMSLTMIERVDLAEGLQLDYGASLDSVTYLDRLNYISP